MSFRGDVPVLIVVISGVALCGVVFLMCGIIGIAGAREIDESALCRARDSLAHRGPDGSGIYIDRARGVGLGHRRLAIIDLSEAGVQPMRSADGRYVVVFNGEIFNYIELREELRGRYEFRTETDTEVLLAAFVLWGPACLLRFNGQFAFAMYDSEQGSLFCARDHFGIKPFFYSLDGGVFRFASEIKGLLALGITPRVNEHAVAEYLADGLHDHSEETFFDGVLSLPPGHTLEYRSGAVSVRAYWDLAERAVPPAPRSEAEAEETLRFLIRDALRLQFRSDVPVGLNLSSGLDSNALHYYAKEAVGASPHLFTACIADERSSECRVLERILSDAECSRWHRGDLGPEDVWERTRELVAIEDQPAGGMQTAAYYALYRATAERSGVTVLLEGQGADEILAGYGSYVPPFYRDLVREARVFDIARFMLVRALNEGIGKFWRSCSRRIIPTRAREHERSSRAGAGVLDAAFRRRIQEHCGTRIFPMPFDSALLNAQYRDIRYTKLPRVLRTNDHISMHFSKELRVPYLDTRLVEFCFFLPDRYKIAPHMRKVLLQRAMRAYLPPALWQRQKFTFRSFQTAWLVRYFAPDVRALLARATSRSGAYTDAEAVERIITETLREPTGDSSLLWRLITLELWLERFIN
ncbi:MAG: asparagine synthase (glutamine-hydrolyzing) [bacterium]|nr:asparagine synthase (glutamine-hydrolyzing) [bacterium]